MRELRVGMDLARVGIRSANDIAGLLQTGGLAVDALTGASPDPATFLLLGAVGLTVAYGLARMGTSCPESWMHPSGPSRKARYQPVGLSFQDLTNARPSTTTTQTPV